MRSRRFALTALAALALAAQAQAPSGKELAPGAWRLVASESSLQFVGIKNDAVGVVGGFTALDGAFDPAEGNGWIEVQVGSANTGDPARDTNITTHFFEAAKFPRARFEVNGLPAANALPAAGRSAPLELAGTLSLHGKSVPLKIAAVVWRDASQRLHVRNARPVVLSAHDLGMDAQLATLKAVCGHTSLSGAVPIEFDVAFAP